MRSLADVAKDSGEDSDEDEGNEYYAGGQKRSAAVNRLVLSPSSSFC